MTTSGVTLYGILGQSFGLSQEEWDEALSAAQRNGWTPAGTYAPPRPLGTRLTPLKWDGGYRQPCGQTVLPQDIRQLSSALGAVAGPQPGIASKLRSFLEESGGGGLLICAGAPPQCNMSRDLHSLASALTSAGRGAVPGTTSGEPTVNEAVPVQRTP